MKYTSIITALENIEKAQATIEKAESDIRSIMSIYANKCSEITKCSSFYDFDKKERVLHIQKVGESVDFMVETKLGFSIIVPIPNDNASSNGIYSTSIVINLIEGIKEIDDVIMRDMQHQTSKANNCGIERIPQDDITLISNKDCENERMVEKRVPYGIEEKGKMPRGR